MFQIEHRLGTGGFSVIFASNDYGAARAEFNRIRKEFSHWDVRLIQDISIPTQPPSEEPRDGV